MSFLMFWIISADRFSTYARYQILLNMTWFINIFVSTSDICECPHFRISSRIFFLPFHSLVPVFGLYCVRKFNLRFLMCPSSI